MLESSNVMKVVWGGQNDSLWMKQDFNINLVATIDLQLLFKHILAQGKIGVLIEDLPNGVS